MNLLLWINFQISEETTLSIYLSCAFHFAAQKIAHFWQIMIYTQVAHYWKIFLLFESFWVFSSPKTLIKIEPEDNFGHKKRNFSIWNFSSCSLKLRWGGWPICTPPSIFAKLLWLIVRIRPSNFRPLLQWDVVHSVCYVQYVKINLFQIVTDEGYKALTNYKTIS